MNFCSTCGARVVRKIPPGDTLPRFVCESCEAIHYQNPKIVVGCIAEWNNQILLCRRGIEPRYGLWTIPAGFMENNETVEEATIRETLEEAHAHVEISSLFGIFSIPRVSQLYIVFKANLLTPEFGIGEESLDVQLMKPADIPWDELAFQVIQVTLERYCQDLKSHRTTIHLEKIAPPQCL